MVNNGRTSTCTISKAAAVMDKSMVYSTWAASGMVRSTPHPPAADFPSAQYPTKRRNSHFIFSWFSLRQLGRRSGADGSRYGTGSWNSCFLFSFPPRHGIWNLRLLNEGEPSLGVSQHSGMAFLCCWHLHLISITKEFEESRGI